MPRATRAKHPHVPWSWPRSMASLTDHSWKLRHAQGQGSRRHHHEPSRFRCALALLRISAPCTLHASNASEHIPHLTPAGWGEAIVGCCSPSFKSSPGWPDDDGTVRSHRMIAFV